MDAFRNTLEGCGLEDLGFVGDPFTWRNNWHSLEGYTRERLDRAVANAGWRGLFPLHKIINGDPRHSDHRPIIAELNGMSDWYKHMAGPNVFRFEARWLQEEECGKVVEEAWNSAFQEGGRTVMEGLRRVGTELSRWDREVLGELKGRIRNARRDLERCRRSPLSQNHVNREHLLRYKLSRLEDQYNLYWRQRAHANWLTKGDRNTKFFQAYASERRRKNIITRLRKEDGSVVEGEEALGNYIANHYKSLFTSSGGILTNDLLSRVPTVVTPEMNARLIRPYSGEEVKKALESIGDLKAPGPNGMPAVFYKKFWELVGMKVQEEVLVLNGNPMPESWNETTIVLIPK
uniref:Reverse transcriptase domain-containing protein n=1 Tax=Triticum urartu TaxID=4572 RepID=A0A8R7JXL8_TRIUA